MPTFSYKGYDFDVDHTPTEAEFTQMSAYVDSLPAKEPSGYAGRVNSLPKPVQGAVGGFEALGSMVGSLPAMVEGFGRKLYTQATAQGTEEEKRQQAQEAAQNTILPQFHAQSDMGKVGEELLGLVPQKIIEGAGNLGASFTEGQTFLNDPKLSNTSQVEQKYGKEGIEAGRTFGQLAGEGLLVAPIVKSGVSLTKRFVKEQPTPTLSPEAAKIVEQRKATQETAQKATKPEMPQEPIVGAQGDLFRDSPEEIIRKQREQAAAESEGIQRDALGNQGDLFVGEGKPLENPLQRGFQEDQAWNQRNAEVEAAQKADTDLIKQREEVAQEPLTLEPEQSAPIIEKMQDERTTYRPAGQTAFGKGQRGSIGFFGKDPFEKFQEDIKRQIPDATPEEIKKVWEEKQASDKQVGVAKAVGKINPKLADNLSIYNDVDKPSALAAVASSPDSPTSTLGFMRNQVLSRGRLGLEKIKNEGVKSGLAYMIGLHDKGGIAANQVLHGPEGILRELRKQEKLFTEGNAGEVLRQRQEAQLNPEYKYNLSPAQMKINEKISKVFEDIRQQMEQITGKKIAQIPNYFPSMFYGPFAVELRDASGKLVAFITEKSAKAAAKEAELVKQQLGDGYTVSEPRFRKEVANNGFKNKAGLAPYFEAMLDLLSSDDPAVLKAQESVQRVVAKRAMDTQQMQNRLKYKAGVIGEEGRKLGKDSTENYRDAKDVLENYIRGFEEWKANMESAKFINEVKEAHGATNTYNILQDYFDNLRGNREGLSKIFNDLSKSLAQSGYDLSGASKETARKTAGLVTKGWLGFWNPAAMAQNILQPLNTFPKLVELATNGGSKDIVSPFLIGMAQSLKDGFDLATHKTLGKDLSERMKYIRENEVIKPGLVEAENRTKVGHYLEKGLVSGGLLSTEAFARGTTFNIFERYLKSSGYDATQARTLAKNLTHDYQVNYENYAKSGAIANSGFIGELAGRLQSYKINQMTQLANYILELKQSKNPAPLAAFLALSIGMAGVSGMIGMDVAEGIYGLLVKDGLVEPDTRSPRQIALDLGGASATGIPSAVTGKWLSGSLSTNLIGDLSWRNIAPIFAGIFDTGSKLPIAGRWAKDVVTGEHTTPLSEKAQLLQAVTPATIRGRLEDKLLTDSEGRVTSPYTGKVTYVNGEKDKDLFSQFTNLRSEQRGESVARSALLKNQEKTINDAINSRVTRLEKLVDESVRMNRPLSDDLMSNELQRILDLGGDPQQTIKKINDFVVTNHLGDWFEQQLIHGKINLGTINKKMRAMQEREKLYGQ